jgi:hypothetical protein
MKDFIPYPEALALKELGFDEPCFGKWLSNRKDYTLILEMGMNEEFEDNRNVYLLQGACSAPTYSQAFRWFREKHDLFGQVNIRTYFIYDISNDDSKMVKKYDKLLTTYEEAELQCLQQLIKIVKEQQK